MSEPPVTKEAMFTVPAVKSAGQAIVILLATIGGVTQIRILRLS